jgi:hypothetical protein
VTSKALGRFDLVPRPCKAIVGPFPGTTSSPLPIHGQRIGVSLQTSAQMSLGVLIDSALIQSVQSQPFADADVDRAQGVTTPAALS